MIRNKLEKLSIAFALAFTVTSCCNDDNGNANRPPSATVTISGTNIVGQMLTATAVTSDADDGDTVTVKYQWYRADDENGTNEEAISEATTREYTLAVEDAGKYLTVGVTTNDGKVDGDEVKADYRGPIAASIGGSNEESSTQVTISPIIGAAVLGKTLIAEFQGFSEEEQSRLTYQWYRADNQDRSANKEAIENATRSEYKTTSDDQDKFIALEVTLPKEGESDAKTAKSSYIYIKENHIPVINNVTINGMHIVGQVLTTNSNVTDENEGDDIIGLSYKWYRIENGDDGKQTETLISGAFRSEYTLVGDDAGRFITVKVTPNDGAADGEEVTADTSAGPIEAANTAPVATNVSIGGNRNIVGNVFAASADTSDADDGDTVTVQYQWYRADDENGTNEEAIPRATIREYKLDSVDADKYITVGVTPNDTKTDGDEVKAEYRGPIVAAP